MTVFDARPAVLEAAADLIDQYADRSPKCTRPELYKLASAMRREAVEGMDAEEQARVNERLAP